MHIEVYKSKKILKLVNKESDIVTYPVGIGKTEVGQKEFRDDQKTPEGEYQVCVKNNKSKFYLSLGLNYPNKSDADRALSAERITKEQHDSILQAINTHGGSDWSTPIGGEIYIHGGLEDKAWSEGCVRMYNQDIKELFDQIDIKTTVIINP